MKNILTRTLAIILCAIVPNILAASSQSRTLDNTMHVSEHSIANQYIVVLKGSIDRSQVSSVATELARSHGGRLLYTYENAIKGFCIQLPAAAASALSHNPLVDHVEQDAEVFAAASQQNAPWGLDRIDQRDLPLNSSYSYSNSGAGVRVYVIDSGIRTTHQEFGRRAEVAYDAVADGQNGQDCYGHGTHVAAVIGGATYGAAKGVSLRAVRVLDCSGRGSVSGVIAGVDWVSANHVKPAVANLSFISTTASDALDASVRSLIAAGVSCVVSAGNNNIDAGTRSPPRVGEAITVAATDASDMRAVFSNYGSVVDVFAPGVDIVSAWVTDDLSTNIASGTSSAAGFVAGVAARYLSGNPSESPAEVSQAILRNATSGKIISAGVGSPNLLLNRPDSKVAFEFNDGKNNGIFLVNTDGTKLLRYTTNMRIDDDINWSPDGRKILFHSDRLGSEEVCVINSDGTGLKKLTNDAVVDDQPAWSPDGRRIAFTSERDGNREIYVMNADGTNQVRLTYNTVFESHPTWSPDGTKIAFNSERDGNKEIYVMYADGTFQTRLTNMPGAEYNPVWSPNGQKIAFESHTTLSDSTLLVEVWVVNVDGSSIVDLTPYKAARDYTPSWSPDSSRLVIARMRATTTGWDRPDIYTINPDGTNPTRLTSDAASDANPSWSPDGSRIVFQSSWDGNSEIYVMNANGSNQTRLTYDEGRGNAQRPAWQPL